MTTESEQELSGALCVWGHITPDCTAQDLKAQHRRGRVGSTVPDRSFPVNRDWCLEMNKQKGKNTTCCLLVCEVIFDKLFCFFTQSNWYCCVSIHESSNDAASDSPRSSSILPFVKYQAKSGFGNPNASIYPLIWPPSDFLFSVLTSTWFGMHLPCGKQCGQCTVYLHALYQWELSLNHYSSISIVTERSWWSTKLPSSEPSSDSSHMSSLANKGFWDSEFRFFKGK